MAEIGVHYAFIKHLHVLSVACSLALFAARWLGVLRQAPWPMRPRVRGLSVAIDTLLLVAGLALLLGHVSP